MIGKVVERYWTYYSVAQDIKIRGKAGNKTLARAGLRSEAEDDPVVNYGLGINSER